MINTHENKIDPMPAFWYQSPASNIIQMCYVFVEIKNVADTSSQLRNYFIHFVQRMLKNLVKIA